MDGQRAVDGVALAPVCPVEHHRGQQQGGPKGNQGSAAPLPFPDQGTHQPQAAPGQQHVPQDGKQLDKVQVGYVQIGDGRHKVEVGGVIIPHAARDGGKAAVEAKRLIPAAQKTVVVPAGIIQAQRPGQHGRPQREQHDAQRVPPISLQAQQGQRYQGQQRQQARNAHAVRRRAPIQPQAHPRRPQRQR